jgi:hypothetical protein
MKKKVLALVAVLALVLGVAGLAVGATVGPTTAKACVTGKGVLKLVQNGKCAGGSKKITVVGTKHQGLVRAYAHVKNDGTIDTARSWRVDPGDLVTTADGFWCFRGLGFTPKGAQVTLDYNGIFNGQIPQATVILPADPGDCGLTSAQAEIFTGLVDPGSFTSGEKLGF